MLAGRESRFIQVKEGALQLHSLHRSLPPSDFLFTFVLSVFEGDTHLISLRWRNSDQKCIVSSLIGVL